MKSQVFVHASTLLLCALAAAPRAAQAQSSAYALGQGIIAGEATTDSVILHARLTRGLELVGADQAGAPGVGRYELSTSKDFTDSFHTPWQAATLEGDCIIQAMVGGLEAGTRYYYRLHFGAGRRNTEHSGTGAFKTLQGGKSDDPISLVVVTGMNYAFFQNGRRGDGDGAYEGPGKGLGYPALKSILDLAPDYFIGTGDNVYYDHPGAENLRAKKLWELRRKWHQQFAQPRFRSLFANVGTYWQKDDHDHRYNDSDLTSDKEPSNELGIATFMEQVPIVDRNAKDPVTYRTHRFSKDLQAWFVEGRDYRSPNRMEDGPDKSIWGGEQLSWLKRSLKRSNATFKLLISPTPMVGPDRDTKIDNHVDTRGFRYEGDAFKQWLRKNGFLKKNFYFVCGDRHWQYHAIDPSGFEEFSCGSLVEANAIAGTYPGEKDSTDLHAPVVQPFHPKEKSAGFLHIGVRPEDETHGAYLDISFYDEFGALLYRTRKVGR